MFHYKPKFKRSERDACFLDRKLDIALKESDVQAFRSYLTESKSEREDDDTFFRDFDYDLLIESHSDEDLLSYSSSTTFLPRVLSDILRGKLQKVSDDREAATDRLSAVFDMMKHNLTIQTQYNLHSCSEGITQNHLNDFGEFARKFDNIPKEIGYLMMALDEFTLLVESLPEGWIPSHERGYKRKVAEKERIIKEKSNIWSKEEWNMEITWSKTMCTIRYGLYDYLLPSAAIQEIHNKISDHVSVLVFAFFASGSYLPSTSYETTLKYLLQLHGYHIRHPKSFFSFAASLEAICAGILLERHEEWENSEFLTSVISAVNEECDLTHEQRITTSSPIITTILTSSSPLVSELSCLSKMSGHPITDSEAGAKKLYSRVNRPRQVKVEAVAYTAQSLKEDYINEYFLSHGQTYPPCDLNPNTHPRIKAAFRMNKSIRDPSLSHLGNIEMSDWSNVTLKEHVSIDFLENMLPHLKDTTISLTRGMVKKKYFSSDPSDPPKDLGFERCLLMYILGNPDDLDHVSFAKSIAESSPDAETFLRELAIKLVEKEKELKFLARFFGCQTYKARGVNQVVIKFCKKYLEKYSSHQALVVTELELIKKLYSFSKMRKGEQGLTSLTLSVDAEAWNNNFFKESVGPPAREVLDAITGSSLFSNIHTFFEETLLYNISRDSVISWDGQLGGIEGLLQELWMICYIHQLRYALRACSFVYDILCKGDDVRIRFQIPTSEVKQRTMPVISDELKKMLSSGLAEFGHKVKLQESMSSTVFFAFSKKWYLEDVALTSSFRQIQKCYGSHNAFHHSLDDYVAAAFSNAHSATGYGINMYAPYCVALFWSGYYIKSHPTYAKISSDEFLAITLVPSVVGGFPIIYLHNMFVRAESDLLSAFLGIALWIQAHYPPLWPILERFIQYQRDSSTSLELLLSDPFSIPIKRPRSGKNILIHAVRKQIRRKAKNLLIKELFSSRVERSHRLLVKLLGSADYFDAKLSAAVMECDPWSVQEKFIQKFTNSKSMIRFLIDTGESNYSIIGLSRSIAAAERMVQEHRKSTLVSTVIRRPFGKIHYLKCPSQLADEMRTYGWKREVHGITYPPIQHQVALFYESEAPLSLQDDHFVYEVRSPSEAIPGLPYPHFTRGFVDPFLGDATPSGTYAAPLQIDSHNTIVNNIKKLLTLLSTVNLDRTRPLPPNAKTFHEVIIHLLKSYTTLDMEELRVFANERKGGTRTHHMAARGYRLEIMPNQVKNMMAHVLTSTNTYTKFRNRSVNYKLNFLYLMCHTSSMIMLNWSFPNTIQRDGRYWASVPPCPDCFIPIDERNTTFSEIDFLLEDPVSPKALSSGIKGAHDLIEQYIENSAESMDFRKVEGDTTPSLQDAQRVIASELSRITIRDHQILSLGYAMIRPTVDAMRDLVKLKGRSQSQRALTGTEIVKIPGHILALELLPFILDFTMSSFDLVDDTHILACYMTYDSKSLPWSSFIYQCQKHGKLAGLIYGINSLFDRSNVNPGSACSNYVAASRYVGVTLSQWILEEYPEDLLTLRFHQYSHTALIRSRATSVIRSRILWCLRKNRFCDFFPHATEDDEGPTDHDYDLLESLLSAMYCDLKSTDQLREELSSTTAKRSIQFAVRHTEDEDTQLDKDFEELPRYLKNWLRIWSKGSPLNAEQLHHLIQGSLSTSVADEGSDLTRLRVELYNIGDCFTLIRESSSLDDLDDYRSPDQLVQSEPGSILSKIDLSKVVQDFSESSYSPPTQTVTWGAVYDLEHIPRKYLPRVDLTHLWRVHGTMTTSAEKLNTIIQGLKIFSHLRQKAFHILCVADGEGGDTRWFLDNFPRSIVHWNSIQETDGLHVPICCRVENRNKDGTVPHPRLRYVSQMVLGGDLLSPKTMEHLHSIPTSFTIIKCDADIPKDHSRAKVAYELWRRVMHLWSVKGSNSGLLIIKVFLDLHEIVSTLMDEASLISSQSTLITLLESHVGYEAYMLLQGPVKPSSIPALPRTATGITRREVLRLRDGVVGLMAVQDAGGITNREKRLCVTSRRWKRVIWPMKIHQHLPHYGWLEKSVPSITSMIEQLEGILGHIEETALSDRTEHRDAPATHEMVTHRIVALQNYIKHKTTSLILTYEKRTGFVELVRTGCHPHFKRDLERLLNAILDQPRFSSKFARGPGTLNLDTEFFRGGARLNLREQMIIGSKIGFEMAGYYAARKLKEL